MKPSNTVILAIISFLFSTILVIAQNTGAPYTQGANTITTENDFVLHQNYPNPFNLSRMMIYGIPEQSNIRIEVFNMLGQSVGLLADGNKSAGYYETT